MTQPLASLRLPLCALTAALACTGCNWDWNRLRGEGFHDEMAGWSTNLRQGPSEGTPLGASNKALEIERNLGYR